MPIVMCSEMVSWVRAACGVPVGMYIDVARLEDRLLDRRPALCTSHCLRPAVCSTNTSWVSECTAKPCAPTGRQVGVGLAGVAERRARARRSAGSAAASSGAGPGRRRSRRRRTGRAPCARRPGRSATGRRGSRTACRSTPAAPCPSLTSRTDGVRIAVEVSRWSTSSRERYAASSAGSTRWWWTRDAQTFSRKVWASPVSWSRTLQIRTRRRPRCRWRRRPCRPRHRRRCRRRRRRRCRPCRPPSVPSASPPPAPPSTGVVVYVVVAEGLFVAHVVPPGR